jgi:hypothetical protein
LPKEHVNYPYFISHEVKEWASTLGQLYDNEDDSEYWKEVESMDQESVDKLCDEVNKNRSQIEMWIDDHEITDYFESCWIYMGLIQALDARGYLK